MIVQKEDLLAQIQEAKRRDLPVAVGGPYPTSLPQEVQDAGADYLVLDEGEITLPMFVEALTHGESSGIFRATEKPSVTTTPIPRYDLLEFDAYNSISIQFSRGCPFQCEFCDIIILYGRKSRTKTPVQLIAELEQLYDLGWRGSVFMVDDNFIGNKRNVKLLLKELKVWMEQKNYPFSFTTEASVDLAQDSELMELMVECNFTVVFLGIETPDPGSLTLAKKFQNTRDPLRESIDKITRAGLRIMAGFILGFDGESAGTGDRLVQFVEQTDIPIAMLGMLQALPNTALWYRLEQEGRLYECNSDGNQTTLMNFVPTRPLEEIAQEYVEAFWQLYDPEKYLDRTFRHFMKLGNRKPSKKIHLSWQVIRALLLLCWRQGVLPKYRWKFWGNLGKILRYKPRYVELYLTVCGYLEHFTEYRQLVRENINIQLAAYRANRTQTIIPSTSPQAREGAKIAK